MHYLLVDEEEVFDSDFASTDEEQEAEDAGEQAMIAEEKEARRVCFHNFHSTYLFG